jgi:hypothetical protein
MKENPRWLARLEEIFKGHEVFLSKFWIDLSVLSDQTEEVVQIIPEEITEDILNLFVSLENLIFPLSDTENDRMVELFKKYGKYIMTFLKSGLFSELSQYVQTLRNTKKRQGVLGLSKMTPTYKELKWDSASDRLTSEEEATVIYNMLISEAWNRYKPTKTALLRAKVGLLRRAILNS